MLAVLLSLGFWQLDRRTWKTDLIQTLEERLAAPTLTVENLPRDPAEDLEFRRFRLQGTFAEHDLELVSRTRNGVVGREAVTPLDLGDGRFVLVLRGFVPAEVGIPDPPDDVVEVTGVFHLPSEPGWMRPDNEPETNEWFWIDPPTMAAASGIDGEALVPGYLVATSPIGDGERWPEVREVDVDLPNRHLQYAITWFSLAVALIVVFVVFLRGRRRE